VSKSKTQSFREISQTKKVQNNHFQVSYRIIEESNQKPKEAPFPVMAQANSAIAFKMNMIVTYL